MLDEVLGLRPRSTILYLQLYGCLLHFAMRAYTRREAAAARGRLSEK